MNGSDESFYNSHVWTMLHERMKVGRNDTVNEPIPRNKKHDAVALEATSAEFRGSLVSLHIRLRNAR